MSVILSVHRRVPIQGSCLSPYSHHFIIQVPPHPRTCFLFFNIFLGTLIPLFQTSGDISSGFQSQSGFCLIQTLWSIHDIYSLRFTSGVTPLPVYMASIVAGRFPHIHLSAEVGCRIRTTDLLLCSQTR